MRKKKPPVLTIGLTVLALVLIVWSGWPLPKTRQVMTLNPDFLDPADLQHCSLLNQLPDYEFELVYPRQLWKAEPASLILTMRRLESAPARASAAPQNTCSLALETRLLADNVSSLPGNTIIESFVGGQSQSFIFTITAPEALDVSGDLWIYASPVDPSGKTSGSIPLFVIPLEMQVLTIFGLSPALVRYIGMLLLVALAALAFRLRIQQRQ